MGSQQYGGNIVHPCLTHSSTGTAQDGQEFSKLLLTLLETKLAGSAMPVRAHPCNSEAFCTSYLLGQPPALPIG